MQRVGIVGAFQTPFGKYLDRSLKSLAEEAVAGTTKDAAISIGEVESFYVGNSIAGLITGQEMVRGQTVLRRLGVSGQPIINVENACASGSTAAHLAWLAVRSGQAHVSMALGMEKMTHPDRSRPGQAIATAMDVETSPAKPGSISPFMDMYAPRIQAYMDRTGATPEDLARVTVKAQKNGALNPDAQYGGDLTVDEVLGDKMIATPLTRMMCSPIGDGAAGVILASEEYIDRHKIPNPVWVVASVLKSGIDPDDQPQALARAASEAFEIASVAPTDLHLIELHDANAGSELMRYEEIGLAPHGEGPRLIRDGTTNLGGDLPVNPSGGLLARGHPIGATGVAQLVELTKQLRGVAGARQVEGATIGLAENGGGWVGGDAAAECVHILKA